MLPQGTHFGKHVSGLAHAHADFFALVHGEDANGPGTDYVQTIAPVAGVEDGIAEFIPAGFCVAGNLLQFVPVESGEDLDGGEILSDELA
jgi:hypothetical protein